ncbi:viroplasmin family protein [Candidatus Azambacteria bacterium]|nr:viroplasmin family protein [Candidatus Azambacteria bacterium]
MAGRKSPTKNKSLFLFKFSLVQGKIIRHLTWAECEKRVHGMKGVKFKKAISANDEQAIIAEWKK